MSHPSREIGGRYEEIQFGGGTECGRAEQGNAPRIGRCLSQVVDRTIDGAAIMAVGKIAHYGGGGAAWILLGTAAAAGIFIGVTVLVARLALRLVAKS